MTQRLRFTAHPALHTPPAYTPELGSGHDHYVAEGWEDFNVGLCPCGEAVRWDGGLVIDGPDGPEVEGGWVPDRTLRVLVLTAEEALMVVDGLPYATTLARMVRDQLDIQEECPE